MMPAWNAASGTTALEFARSFLVRIDSVAASLIDRFRNASGQPVAGASDPSRLVSREKSRWQHCRNIKEDLQTFSDNIPLLRENLPGPVLQNSWDDLGEKINDMLEVLEKCETVAYMIEAPDAVTRFAPWETNYATSARAFYADWYTKLTAMHASARSVATRLNPSLPADRRLTMIPLSPTSPIPGGAR